MLYGREAECALIDSLIARAAEARSGLLVLRGGPGIGKSALLDYGVFADAVKVRRSHVGVREPVPPGVADHGDTASSPNPGRHAS